MQHNNTILYQFNTLEEKMNEEQIKRLFDENLEKKPEKPKKNNDEGIKGFIKTLFLAIILAVGIRSFLLEPFHIPSGSMKPGLLVGDYIFVSKMSYGYSKHSFPFSSFNLFDGRFFEDEPKRGEPAVFRLPSDPSINYIKRIIALPGDTIRATNGNVYLNNQKLDKEYINNFIDSNGQLIPIFQEKNDNKDYLVLEQYEGLPQDNMPEYLIPANYYFVMGDNRDNSQDSRFQQVGLIPKENLVGKAVMIFFSVNEPVWKIWKWYKSIRFKRVFKRIR